MDDDQRSWADSKLVGRDESFKTPLRTSATDPPQTNTDSLTFKYSR